MSAEIAASLRKVANDAAVQGVQTVTTAALRIWADEMDALVKRNAEHEQFRLQHRGCDQMGVALQQIGRLVKAAQASDVTPMTATEVGLLNAAHQYRIGSHPRRLFDAYGIQFKTRPPGWCPPETVIDAAYFLQRWSEENQLGTDWQVYGIGPRPTA